MSETLPGGPPGVTVAQSPSRPSQVDIPVVANRRQNVNGDLLASQARGQATAERGCKFNLPLAVGAASGRGGAPTRAACSRRRAGDAAAAVVVATAARGVAEWARRAGAGARASEWVRASREWSSCCGNIY